MISNCYFYKKIKEERMKNIFALITLFVLLLFSCSETANQYETKRLTLSELRTAAGFSWFPVEYDAYSPDENIVNQIEQIYNASQHRFFIFTNPSCACIGTQKYFPSVIKTLIEAGVSENNFEIYSTPTLNTTQPYDKWFKLNGLPATFTMKISGADTSFYSVFDSLETAKFHKPDTSDHIEHFILYSLR